MTSAIELSVKFGLPLKKVEEICEYLNVELRDEDFDVDKEFEFIARCVKRSRTSAYTLAWLYAVGTDEQRDFIFEIDQNFHAEYLAMQFPIGDDELFENAKRHLTKLQDADGKDRAAWVPFIDWIKARAAWADTPVSHGYFAVRLLLSLPIGEMKDYPGTLARILNRARYYGFLDGWHTTVQRDGKNVVMYHKPNVPAEPIVKLDISQSEIDSCVRRLGSDDIKKVASMLAWEKKLDMKQIEIFLRQKTLEKFDL